MEIEDLTTTEQKQKKGHNNYVGSRSKIKPLPTPTQGPSRNNEIQFNYYRSHFSPMHQVLAHKCINKLLHVVSHGAKRFDPIITGMLPTNKDNNIYGASNGLLTFGIDDDIIGFANTLHVDLRDAVLKKDWTKILIVLDEFENSVEKIDKEIAKHLAYAREFVTMFGFGLPTTCIYQFMFGPNKKESQGKVIQYFIMAGLGIAVEVNTNVCHMMHAYTFGHCTAIPFIMVGGKYFLTSSDGTTMFAWGTAVPKDDNIETNER